MANPYINQIQQGEVSGIPAEQAIQLSRQQRIAQQLLEQGQQPLEGQMVSGHYVAPSWTQYLAKGVQSYLGNKGMKDVEGKQQQAIQAKRQAIADLLKGQTPQSIGEGNAMRQETPEEVQARIRPMLYEAVSTYGNDPALQLALGDLNYGRERQDKRADVQDTRDYEEKLYNRGRADKLSDTEADRKYQDIVRKDTQGFQISQQDRQFAQAYKMQQAQQNFTAQQQRQNQAFQSDQNSLSRAQQMNIEKAKLGGVNGMPKLTEDQGKAMGWLSQANNAYANMKNVMYDEKGNLKTNVVKPSLAETGLQTLGLEGSANMLRSAPRQQFLQATSSMGEAILRAATGAGVTRDEALQKQKELTPQYTDSNEVVQQKLNAIPVYLESLKARAGAGAKLVPNLNTQPMPTNNPFPSLNINPSLIDQELARRGAR